MYAVEVVVMADVTSVGTKRLLMHLIYLLQKRVAKSAIMISNDCNDKYFMHLFSRRTCGKQYTGKTTNCFRYRWNSYKMKVRKTESVDMKNVNQKFLQSHFLLGDHQGFL